jgi:dephospho-CoA kinase
VHEFLRSPGSAPDVLKVGLTGGIASGKSVVGEMFVALGAQLIQADQIAHQLMQPGQAVYQEVVSHFGAEILNPDGTVNRGRLAEAAFGSPVESTKETKHSRIQELNQIVHPAVIRQQEAWMEEVGARNPQAIRIVVVTCRSEQRVRRWAERTKVDEETARQEVSRRMAAQLTDEEKIKAADYLVDNSGSFDETRKQVVEIYSELKGLAEKSA